MCVWYAQSFPNDETKLETKADSMKTIQTSDYVEHDYIDNPIGINAKVLDHPISNSQMVKKNILIFKIKHFKTFLNLRFFS